MKGQNLKAKAWTFEVKAKAVPKPLCRRPEQKLRYTVCVYSLLDSILLRYTFINISYIQILIDLLL